MSTLQMFFIPFTLLWLQFAGNLSKFAILSEESPFRIFPTFSRHFLFFSEAPLVLRIIFVFIWFHSSTQNWSSNFAPDARVQVKKCPYSLYLRRSISEFDDFEANASGRGIDFMYRPKVSHQMSLYYQTSKSRRV